ncbi:MAG: acyl-CoA dehydrogenase family protein [Bacillota bacterium]
MDFTFNESQEALGKTARKFFQNECPAEFIRKLYEGDRVGIRPLWQKIAEQGYLGALSPEEYDGTGLDPVDIVPIMEAAGRSLAPGPLVETVGLAVPLLVSSGSEEQKQRLLPAINAGEVLVTSALSESLAEDLPAGIQTQAIRRGNSFILNGTKTWVADADLADLLVVAARTGVGTGADGVTVFLVPANAPGISKTVVDGVDRSRQFSHISFNDVEVGSGDIIGRVHEGWGPLASALNIATVFLCSTMAGGVQHVLEMSVEYAKIRQQFGSFIGRFQAIKHRLADLLLEVESSKSATYYAAWAVATDQPNASQAVSIAKSYVGEAYAHVCAENVQIHGGIGFTWENDAHLYLKRAKANEVQFGSSRSHREKVAASLGW